MPSDIRAFFGGKGGPPASSSQEQKSVKESVCRSLHRLQSFLQDFSAINSSYSWLSLRFPSLSHRNPTRNHSKVGLELIWDFLVRRQKTRSRVVGVSLKSTIAHTEAKSLVAKRKVVSDSDDEDEGLPGKMSTPKKPPPKKQL